MSLLTRSDDGLLAQPIDSILEAKLRPPPARTEWMVRPRLLEKLARAGQRAVTLIAAPAGYGKTTLVTQWLASKPATAKLAWISLDSTENESARLWTHIATALDRAGCSIARDIAGFIAAGRHDMMTAVLPRIIDAIAVLPAEVTVLIDDFHILRSGECNGQMEFFVKHLPLNAHLVLITRTDPILRLGRLRAAGQLAEIRAEDLAFTEDEVYSILACDGVQLSSDSISEHVHLTERWPAGVYLSALS